MSDPTGPSSVSLDEMETATQTKPNLGEMKLESDELPENLRGKSVAEVVKMLADSNDLLKKSEAQRIQSDASLRTMMERPTPVAPPPTPEPEPVKEYTREELTEMYEKDPVGTIAVMQEQSLRAAERNLETRLGPMISGSAATAERNAREKYADEFALFGEEITSIARGIPNAKAALANPQAWDDIIALVRGRTGNFDKLIARKTAPKQEVIQQEAQKAQQDTVGFSENGVARRAIPRNAEQLDSLQKEIADKMGISYADYAKWSQIS